MGLKSLAGAALFSLALGGCGSNDLMLKKQTEMEARLEQLVQKDAGLTARVDQLSAEVKELQSQSKANTADLAELKPAYRALKASVEGVSEKVAGKTPVLPPKIVVVNKGAFAEEGESGEQSSYMQAFGLFSTNSYTEAIAAFQGFIKKYPASEYAGNAQYWIGECYYTQRDFNNALAAFRRVLEGYPKSSKVPDAMLKIGFSHISLGQHEKARVALEELVEKYPRSQAAAKARERLNH